MTVFTPEALRRSIEKGSMKTCRLSEWLGVDGDEMFIYIFPARDPINFTNGDGDLIEVIDFKADFSEIDLECGKTIKASPDTTIYYR